MAAHTVPARTAKQSEYANKVLRTAFRQIWDYSPLTYIIAQAFRAYSKCYPVAWWFGSRVEFQTSTTEDTQVRAKCVDCYVLFCVFLEVLVFALVSSEPVRIACRHFGWLQLAYCLWTQSGWYFGGIVCYVPHAVCILVCLKIAEILVVSVNIAIFDRLYVASHRVAAFTRNFVLITINFFELIILFGILYSWPGMILPEVLSRWDPIYFSVITQLTVGYGDLVPTGFGRLFAVMQAVIGYFFTLLVISRFVASIPPVQTFLGDGPNEDMGRACLAPLEDMGPNPEPDNPPPPPAT